MIERSPLVKPGGLVAVAVALALVALLVAPAGRAWADDPGALEIAAQEVVGAGEMWNDRHTGAGVDVAVIDTGVAPVEGLATPGKLVHGPDLSFESQHAPFRHLDTYGHGTHVAGIIAGRAGAVPTTVQKGEQRFVGVAPDARIVSLKVGDASGAVDVSQVVAAVEWVVAHRRAHGLNIRVLNLSYGTDGTQPAALDPLAHAVEVAWRKGIAVVVSAGNGGYGDARLNLPAYDPHVIAVGALDDARTTDRKDDSVPGWSSRGDARRHPDVLAPGRAIVSLQVGGSALDAEHAGAREPNGGFRGSGTSQAAAFVAGAAALLIDQRPSISPERLKALLTATAAPLPGVPETIQGAGVIDLKQARDAATPAAPAAPPRSTGAGELEAARGTSHLAVDGVELRGERDVFGAPWRGAEWAAAASAEDNWAGGTYNGNEWTGTGFAHGAWTSVAWSAPDWSGAPWTRSRWGSATWSRSRWGGGDWSRSRWGGNTWAGNTWSSVRWGD